MDRVPFDYYVCAQKDDFPNRTPLALKPMSSNHRVGAQSGAFTFHSSEIPLEEMVIAKRVQVRHSFFKKLRQKMLDEGANHFRMLGGPDGLAKFMEFKYLQRK